jgi:hypothetical protein
MIRASRSSFRRGTRRTAVWRTNRRSADCHTGKPHYAHGLCHACWQRVYRKRHPQQYTQEQRAKKSARAIAWKKAHRVRAARSSRNSWLRRKYGISLLDFNKMAKAQNDKCWICQRRKKLGVDHCHKTNRVRKLLCVYCNGVVGVAEKHIHFTKRLSVYIRIARRMAK